MELSRQHSFLVTGYSEASSDFTVRLVVEYGAVLASWGPLTRISPVWGVSEFGTSPAAGNDFEGESQLLFLGPVRPATLLSDHPQLASDGRSPISLWVTLGAFNLVARCSDPGTRKIILDWAEKKQVPFEVWTLTHGRVSNVTNSIRRNADGACHGGLRLLAESRPPAELAAGIREYCALMASALSRSAEISDKILSDLRKLDFSVGQFIADARKSVRDIPNAQAIITNINAGLSRFSSQAFSGTRTLFHTESHFWYHSLLGVCVANIALERLNSFVFQKLGAERIAKRLEKLEKRTTGVPNFSLMNQSDEMFVTDHLSGIVLTEEDRNEAIVPLITFFSGRDGFKSHLYTLSAPLATISACNSLRWNLMTITHEISHVFVKSVISLLYPDIQVPDQINHALRLLNYDNTAEQNWLDSIRLYLLHSVISMENEENELFKGDTVRLDADRLKKLLDDWRGEVEEIMAHTFDFLYFYRSDPENYIKGIWLSWGVIPNISNRVREYVMRTVCATLSQHLRRGNEMVDAAIDDALTALRQLPDSREPDSYSGQAVQHIEQHRDYVVKRVHARKPIVRIVRAFLYSDAFASSLWSEPLAAGSAGARRGYPTKIGILDETRISNPLSFLDAYTSPADADASQSTWMLNALAFNVEDQ